MLLTKLWKYRWLGLAALSLICLGLFAKLSEEVINHENLTQLDHQVSAWVVGLRTPFLNIVMQIITELGNPVVVVLIVLVAIGVLLYIREKRWILPLLLVSISSLIFSGAIKVVIGRPRPAIAHALVVETGYSYPSGHALIAASLYGLLAYIVYRNLRVRWQRALALAVGILVVLAVGFSRIYLGVHWPTDILASYALGGVWLFAIMALVESGHRLTRIFRRIMV